MRSLVRIGALCSLFLVVTSPVRADDSQIPIAEEVAEVLFDRAMTLYGQGDIVNAKQLFVETVDKAPQGPKVGDATAMVRSCNERLELPALDGLPGHRAGQPRGPLGDQASNEASLRGPQQAADSGTQSKSPAQGSGSARVTLTVWGGVAAFAGGLALGGPLDDAGDPSAAAVILSALGAGLGATGGHFLAKRYRPDLGQAAVVTSLGFWGGYEAWLLGDIITGDNSDTNDLYKYLAVGAVVGTGAGTALTVLRPIDAGDMAAVNSLTTYGSALGLLLAVVIDPPKSEAFSLQASIGAAAGMATGFALTDRLKLSRRRTLWLDVGAGAGAIAPWLLMYPFIESSDTNNDEQLAGALSMLSMSGAVVLAWYLTDGMDDTSPPGPLAFSPVLLPGLDGRPALGMNLVGGVF